MHPMQMCLDNTGTAVYCSLMGDSPIPGTAAAQQAETSAVVHCECDGLCCVLLPAAYAATGTSHLGLLSSLAQLAAQ